MRQTFTPIVVNHPQRSEEWYAARLGNVTASRATDTMSYYAVQKNHLVKADEYFAGNSDIRDSEWLERMREEYPVEYCLSAGVALKESAARQGYRQMLVTERLTGLPGQLDPYVTKDMQWGIVNERFARDLYGLRYNMKVEDAPLMLHPTMLCGASPDGLPVDKATGELGNLEIKCLSSKNHLYKVIMENTMPDDYWEQVQMQMWITGRDWCDFVGYDSRVKEHLQLFVKRIEYDEFYVDNVLLPSIRRFLDECDKDERMFYAIMRRKEEEAKELVTVA